MIEFYNSFHLANFGLAAAGPVGLAVVPMLLHTHDDLLYMYYHDCIVRNYCIIAFVT